MLPALPARQPWGSAARILAAPALFEQVVEGAGNVRAGGPWFCATEVGPFHQLISLPNRAQQPRAGAIDFGRPSTSADERSMAEEKEREGDHLTTAKEQEERANIHDPLRCGVSGEATTVGLHQTRGEEWAAVASCL